MPVKNSDKNGTMQIRKGDCLITSKPFVYVLSSNHKDDHCDFCFKSGNLLKCSGCQYVYYCDRNCQKQSWNIHKSECPNLKRILPRTIPDAAHLLARIIIKLQKGGGEEKEYYGKNSFRKFKDLMSHYTDIKNDPKRMEHFISLCQVLKDFMGSSQLPNSAEILGMFGRICVNSYNILDLDMNSIGVGIYLAPSVIDHSCKPNAVATFEGTTISIRALDDISTLDWSQIHISYIDELNTTELRQSKLQKYYFLCQCEKCKTPEIYATAAICLNCENACDIEQAACSNCAKEISTAFKEKFKEVTIFTEGYLETLKNVAYLDISKTCLSKQNGVLHPLNIQHVRTIESAFDAAVNLGYWEDAENFGVELVPGYMYYYGEFHPLTGILFVMLGKIQLFLNKPKSALEEIRKAEKILKITHGEKHSYFKENLKPLLYRAVIESQQCDVR